MKADEVCGVGLLMGEAAWPVAVAVAVASLVGLNQALPLLLFGCLNFEITFYGKKIRYIEQSMGFKSFLLSVITLLYRHTPWFSKAITLIINPIHLYLLPFPTIFFFLFLFSLSTLLTVYFILILGGELLLLISYYNLDFYRLISSQNVVF